MTLEAADQNLVVGLEVGGEPEAHTVARLLDVRHGQLEADSGTALDDEDVSLPDVSDLLSDARPGVPHRLSSRSDHATLPDAPPRRKSGPRPRQIENRIAELIEVVEPPEHCRELGYCQLWTGSVNGSAGYPTLTVGSRSDPRGQRKLYVHRWSLEQRLGRPIRTDHEACHHCDNPRCVAPEHLYEGTRASNVADMIARGRNNPARGERAGKAKLTESDVVEIRRRVADGEYAVDLALEYGVSQTAVSAAARGESWAHVAEPTTPGHDPVAVNRAKTHCLNGHSLSGTNLYAAPNGSRQCRTCKRARKRAWRAAGGRS